jgi:sec-independent protein translocase protein TatC
MFAFISSCFQTDPIVFYMTLPLRIYTNSLLISTDLAEFWYTTICISLNVALFAIFPVLLYNFWAFIIPSFYKRERILWTFYFVLSLILFFLGLILIFFFIIPFIIHFLFKTQTSSILINLKLLTKLWSYISFVIQILFIFCCVFQMPVFLAIFFEIGLLNQSMLTKNRKSSFFFLMILSAWIAPPDLTLQCFLTFFFFFLYEFSIFYSVFQNSLGEMVNTVDLKSIPFGLSVQVR